MMSLSAGGLAVLIAATTAVPIGISIWRSHRWFGLVLALSLVGAVVWPVWPVAMLVAIFGPRERARRPKLNGAGRWVLVCTAALVALTVAMPSASATNWEHHARRNWVQDNVTGNCLWKLHIDAYWNDSGNSFVTVGSTRMGPGGGCTPSAPCSRHAPSFTGSQAARARRPRCG